MNLISLKETYISFKEAYKSQWSLRTLKRLVSLKEVYKS